MSQKSKVMNYMKTHGGITTAQAFGFGCCRLSERVRELERDGYPIDRTWIGFQDRDGNKGRCVRYSLRDDPDKIRMADEKLNTQKTDRKRENERISI